MFIVGKEISWSKRQIQPYDIVWRDTCNLGIQYSIDRFNSSSLFEIPKAQRTNLWLFKISQLIKVEGIYVEFQVNSIINHVFVIWFTQKNIFVCFICGDNSRKYVLVFDIHNFLEHLGGLDIDVSYRIIKQSTTTVSVLNNLMAIWYTNVAVNYKAVDMYIHVLHFVWFPCYIYTNNQIDKDRLW